MCITFVCGSHITQHPFGEEELYNTSGGRLQTYDYRTGMARAICLMPDGRVTSLQIVTDVFFHVSGYVTVLAKLCEALNCLPGDLLEYRQEE